MHDVVELFATLTLRTGFFLEVGCSFNLSQLAVFWSPAHISSCLHCVTRKDDNDTFLAYSAGPGLLFPYHYCHDRINLTFEPGSVYLCLILSSHHRELVELISNSSSLPTCLFAGYRSYNEFCSEWTTGAGKTKQCEAHARRCTRHSGTIENLSRGRTNLGAFQPFAYSDPERLWTGLPAECQHCEWHPLCIQASKVCQNGCPSQASSNQAQACGFPQNHYHKPCRWLSISTVYWQVLYCLNLNPTVNIAFLFQMRGPC